METKEFDVATLLNPTEIYCAHVMYKLLREDHILHLSLRYMFITQHPVILQLYII